MAKNRIHSVLTSLPPLMLIIGLIVYYRGEKAQTDGSLIIQESQVVSGHYAGHSVVKGTADGKHYLWLETTTRKRGARINPEYVAVLQGIDKGDAVTVEMAPTVSGSKTLWVYRVLADGQLLLDAAPDSAE